MVFSAESFVVSADNDLVPLILCAVVIHGCEMVALAESAVADVFDGSGNGVFACAVSGRILYESSAVL